MTIQNGYKGPKLETQDGVVERLLFWVTLWNNGFDLNPIGIQKMFFCFVFEASDLMSDKV